MEVFGLSLLSMLENFTSFLGVLIVFLALMQSICVAGIVFAIRHRQKDDAINGASAGSIASILAFVTLGCPTCGMTLLTPLLTMVAGTGAIALAERLGIILSIVAFVLLFFTLVQLGYQIFVNVSAERAKEKHAKSN
jgi:threonine/homoserine efflux transporter RhtA